MTLSVGLFDGDHAEWDGFVRGTVGWTHFHLFGWKRVMESALRHECLYLAARDSDGRLAGVLPLVRVKSLLFGHYLVSMPFLNYGGPLGSDAAVQALATYAAERARADGVKLLELRSRRALPVDLPVSQRKITVLLDLTPGDPEAVWKQLPAKLRSQVRRPQKEGITVRFGADQLEPFYAVFARHMRDLGTPVLTRRLFEALATTFADDVWFGCAYLGTTPIAAACGLRWGDEFEITWASALSAYNRIAPNMLLYWSLIERCSQAGLRVFNFGRCTPDSSTHRFKRQWGSRDEPLWWYQQAADATAGTPSPDDPKYAWGPRLWKHLPLALANRIGPLVVRLVP
jgi:FemAB-related protein (PEP-CTERM system-associated)